jgi:negative regulator of flagellin synthesis FlgM
MEINGKNSLVVASANVQRLETQQASNKPQRQSDGSSASTSDRIELSVRSLEIQQLDRLIQSTPDVRAARVAEVRSAIENGTYNVKAEQIADKIIGGSLIDEVF